MIEYIKRIKRYLLFRFIRPYILHPLERTFIWNLFRLFFSIIFEKIILMRIKLKNKKINPKDIKSTNNKKVLLCYSKRHFDPESKELIKEGSASNLARQIYLLLKENGYQIEYLDQKEKKVLKIEKLIIGIISNAFLVNSKANHNAKKILFLVNSHPIFKLKQLLKESWRTKIMFSPYECSSLFLSLKSLLYADKFILIGNDFVENTFLERQISKEKIFTINSGVNTEKLLPNYNLRTQKIRFLYSPGYIGIRKGLIPLLDYWDHLEDELHKKIELIILGQTEHKILLEKIQNLIKKRPNVKFIGFVESNTKQYLEILQSCHSIIFPSIEEGQVGSVLEAMCTGCVPIITPNCGIRIEDEKNGFLIKDLNNKLEIADYIRKIVYDKNKYDQMSFESRKFVEVNHNWQQFKISFKQILEK